MDHGGSSFSDSQEAVDAIAHFTVELPDGGPFQRIALVRHELDAVESCVCARSALVGRTKRKKNAEGRGRRGLPDAIFTAVYRKQ